ncbi:MAG: hypothetical protein COV43_07765 [Deltaproteobacteria bacterium CG11_big_fil_rev_8_21_14_0_20_42_23]|nr:MAG: hypothetical protein COV43_07765 [Deltaproteobacteria bacterium CG11_big_fil_rev_8_21_14_0_20_42_23]PJC63448.1 MAG: hypothetical protein CO021_09385 [Deltaproteobacteria bacterium CG_4_9_14_0_2_um_filter_42_21]
MGEGAQSPKNKGESKMENKTPKQVYVVQEEKEGKSRWKSIGVAFVNKDGSLNIFLDALPLNGKLHVRDAKPKT